MKTKDYLLRITDSKTFPALERLAREKRWSVNTLINSILEDAVKKDVKKPKKNLVISR